MIHRVLKFNRHNIELEVFFYYKSRIKMNKVKRKRGLRPISAFLLPLFIAASLSHAQYHGPSDFHGAVKLAIPFPTTYPPITLGMPPDVLTGYLVFDSLMHIPIRGYLVDSTVNAIYDSDTLRYVLKYAYEMKDYDPIAFFQLTEMFPWTGEYLERRPASLINRVLSRVGTAIPDSGKILMSLAYADAIVDLTVIDTFSVIDTTKPSNANVCEGVKATINDIIKGQNLPACSDTLYRAKGKQRVPASAPGDCLAFQYWYYWLQNIQIPLGVTTYNRSPWCVPDSEYIVFLKLDGLGRDSVQYYATLTPIGMSFSTLDGMYPVRGGVVCDPNNDLGFGTGLTVSEFKSKLRQKILSITSY
jgi:hypothetical protein